MGNMNRFISFFALLAVASSAPASKSDADAAIHILGRAPIIGVGGLTTYANGAQVPTVTPAVAAATAAHLAAKGTPILQDVAVAPVAHVGYAGYGGWPYAHYIGKREADSDADILIPGRAPITFVGAFTTYANGAVVPTDTPAVAAATSAHLAARGTPALHTGYVAHIGYAGYPFAGHFIGKREAESDAYLGYGYGLGYGIQHVPAVTSVGGLTTYSNGAVVPTDFNNLAATSAHLAGKAHGLHLIGKREAEPYYGVYGAYPVTSSVITSINPAVTAYANGAIVPTDPIGLAATSAHLNEKAAQAARNILG